MEFHSLQIYIITKNKLIITTKINKLGIILLLSTFREEKWNSNEYKAPFLPNYLLKVKKKIWSSHF